MKRNSEVYSLNKGYSSFIYKSETGLMYSFPVSSGFIDLSFEFAITEHDLNVLKSNNYKFKVLYYVVFYEAQSTFGMRHTTPRKYTAKEFEIAKNKVLYQYEPELKLYVKEFSKRRNLGEDYFQ
ncbi:hypothetical protein [Aestuariibaculum marinum]|uniref:Uncharacterized protein n=1 Tax=Aestuariibaculum marinum TaxID=2683592 RepID=A0A8J6U2Z0_9FLAO|nr:hypothetical protein [Aestuariibaculum marinum]MBD0822717.1 hypothetical protein [Aestuariibaculum marinum]